MKNKLSDLNDHLFAQIERLSDEKLTAEEIEREVKRCDAIVDVADKIIQNASLHVQAAKILSDHGIDPTSRLSALGGGPTGAKFIEGKKS